MRTKTLLGLAVLAAGAVTAVAQSNVYSLNVVGYINVTVPGVAGLGGFALIANQLNTTNNNINNVLLGNGNMPVGSQFFKYAGGGYTSTTWDDLAVPAQWDNNTILLNPGEGGFFHNGSTGGQTMTNTFVGEVLQGNLTNTFPGNNLFAIISSMVPQQGTATGDLKLGVTPGTPPEAGDQLSVYNAGYSVRTYDDLIPGWDNGDVNGPTILVGQSFFHHAAPGSANPRRWIRNFTVQ